MDKVSIDNIILEDGSELLKYGDKPVNVVSCLFDKDGNRKTNSISRVELEHGHINNFNTIEDDDIFVIILSFTNSLEMEIYTLSDSVINEKNKINVTKEYGKYKKWRQISSLNGFVKEVTVLPDNIQSCLNIAENEMCKVIERLK